MLILQAFGVLPCEQQACLKRRQKDAGCFGGPSMTIPFKFLDDLFLSGDLSLQLSDVPLSISRSTSFIDVQPLVFHAAAKRQAIDHVARLPHHKDAPFLYQRLADGGLPFSVRSMNCIMAGRSAGR